MKLLLFHKILELVFTMPICEDCGKEITEDQSNACDHLCMKCFQAYEQNKRFSSSILLLSGIVLALNGILLVIITFLPQEIEHLSVRVLSGIFAIVCLVLSPFLLFIRVQLKDKEL